jgi:hypothetical protein
LHPGGRGAVASLYIAASIRANEFPGKRPGTFSAVRPRSISQRCSAVLIRLPFRNQPSPDRGVGPDSRAPYRVLRSGAPPGAERTLAPSPFSTRRGSAVPRQSRPGSIGDNPRFHLAAAPAHTAAAAHRCPPMLSLPCPPVVVGGGVFSALCAKVRDEILKFFPRFRFGYPGLRDGWRPSLTPSPMPASVDTVPAGKD